MALDFPSSPSEGQIFSGFIFTGGLWQSVPIRTALPFNYIVNPAMQISQQNGDASSNVSGYYPADQWMLAWNVLSTYAARAASTEPLGAPYTISFSPTAAKPSLAATDYAFFDHRIEGNRVADLQWGTAAAKQAVLRFSASATTPGNYAVSLRNGLGNRSYVVSFAATVAWKEFSFAIPGDTTGTWAKDATMGLDLGFCGAAGSTFLTAANAWTAGNFLGPTGMSNLAATATQTLAIGRVGLYADPYLTGKAPPWETPNERQAYTDCKRYFYTCRAARGLVGSATVVSRMGVPHLVPMRTGPSAAKVGTVTVNEATVNNAFVLGTGYPNPYCFETEGTSTGMTAGRAALMIASSGLGGIELNARM